MSLVKLTKEQRDEMRGRLSKVRSAIDNNAKPEARELVNELQRDLKKLGSIDLATLVADSLEEGVEKDMTLEQAQEAFQEKVLSKLGKESGSSESTSGEDVVTTPPSPSKTPEPEKQKSTPGKGMPETLAEEIKADTEKESPDASESQEDTPEASKPTPEKKPSSKGESSKKGSSKDDKVSFN